MVYRTVRRIAIVCSVAALGMSTPAETRACRFFDCFFGRSQTTYAPPYTPQTYAPAYSSGYAPGQPQTGQYVPQTCYRTVYQQVPVTSYRSATRYNPLTGFPVTSYYPVTTWTQQARLVPYTTYRLVYSKAYSPRAGYGSYVGGISTGSSGAASSDCGPTTTVTTPYNGPTEATTPPPSTFQQSEKPAAEEKPLQPVPDTNLNSTMPGLNGPANRTTARPVRQASYYHLIATTPRATTIRTAPVNDGGWRASSD